MQLPLPLRRPGNHWGKRRPMRRGRSRRRTAARVTPVDHIPLPFWGDDEAEFEETLRDHMTLDDALVCEAGRLRLEYNHLARGWTHYRLYQRGTLVGIADVITPRELPDVQRKLALTLTAMGFTPENTRLVKCGAQTPMEATKRAPYLWFDRRYGR